MAMSKEERLAERKRVDAFMASKQKQMAAGKKPASAPAKKPVSIPAKKNAASENAAKLRKNITDKYAPSGFHRLIKALGG